MFDLLEGVFSQLPGGDVPSHPEHLLASIGETAALHHVVVPIDRQGIVDGDPPAFAQRAADLRHDEIRRSPRKNVVHPTAGMLFDRHYEIDAFVCATSTYRPAASSTRTTSFIDAKSARSFDSARRCRSICSRPRAVMAMMISHSAHSPTNAWSCL